MAAVALDGYALRYAGTPRKDTEVVKTAVAQSGYALQSAVATPRKDKDVVMVAVTRSGEALRYARLCRLHVYRCR